MEAIYLFLIIIFIPLLVFFWTVTTLVIYCNPNFPNKDSLIMNIVNDKCSWVPNTPDPLIQSFKP